MRKRPGYTHKSSKKYPLKAGKRYVYTLIFGEGGGFNPENPDPENPDPEPVLVPITFDVTVDNFVEYPQDLDASVPDSKPGK